MSKRNTTTAVASPEWTPEQVAAFEARSREYEAQSAREGAAAYLRQVKYNAECLIEQLERYATRIEAGDANATASDLLNWAINEIDNFDRNANHSTGARWACKLGATGQ